MKKIKKTLTISSNLKIDTSAISTVKKSFLRKSLSKLEKLTKSNQAFNQNINQDLRKKNPAKFIEQQTTKDLQKDNKPTGKSKFSKAL